jgi:hypothetical protein
MSLLTLFIGAFNQLLSLFATAKAEENGRKARDNEILTDQLAKVRENADIEHENIDRGALVDRLRRAGL